MHYDTVACQSQISHFSNWSANLRGYILALELNGKTSAGYRSLTKHISKTWNSLLNGVITAPELKNFRNG